jgi:hypothetical protein
MYRRRLDYYNVGPRAKPDRHGQVYPARYFEEITGIEGIAGDYHLPDLIMQRFLLVDALNSKHVKSRMPTPPSFMETFAHVAQENGNIHWPMFKSIWDDLVVHNPTLERLEFDRNHPPALLHATHGVLSGFNIDDINHFITSSTEQLCHKDRVAWARGYDFFFPGWQTSPETVALIDKKLEEKGAREGKPFYKFIADHKGEIKSGPQDFLFRFM